MVKDPDEPSEKELSIWANRSHTYTINLIRKLYKLPPLSEKEVNCTRCGQPFKSQVVGKKRVQFYCSDCHADLRALENKYG